MKREIYYILANKSGDGWLKTNARTLRGAKAVCTRTYHDAFGVTFFVGVWNGYEVMEVSLRPAFGRWRDI